MKHLTAESQKVKYHKACKRSLFSYKRFREGNNANNKKQTGYARKNETANIKNLLIDNLNISRWSVYHAKIIPKFFQSIQGLEF